MATPPDRADDPRSSMHLERPRKIGVIAPCGQVNTWHRSAWSISAAKLRARRRDRCARKTRPIVTLLEGRTLLSGLPTTYTTKVSFLQALGSQAYKLESFENGRPTAFDITQQSSYMSNGQRIVGSWPASIAVVATGGKHPTDGVSYVDWGSVTTTDPTGSIIMGFHTPITAIGFFTTDFGDTTQPNGYTGVLTVRTNQGESWTLAQTPQPNAK